MIQQVNDKIRLLRQDIRALEREAAECRRKVTEPHLLPTVVLQLIQQAQAAEAKAKEKEADIQTLRNSIQLDLFKPQP